MSDITTFIALARDHVKSDGDDDNLLTQYANSAVGVAAGFCRRNLYWDADTMAADKATYLAQLTAAEDAYQTAKDTYGISTGSCTDTAQARINARMLDASWDTYNTTLSALTKINNGILINDPITAALLLITGHLYRNRQEVVSQAGAVAIQLPMGAQRILEPFMAV